MLKDLEDKKILLWPKIFIHPSCDGEIPLLKDMITSLKGTIAPKVGKHLFASQALIDRD